MEGNEKIWSNEIFAKLKIVNYLNFRNSNQYLDY